MRSKVDPYPCLNEWITEWVSRSEWERFNTEWIVVGSTCAVTAALHLSEAYFAQSVYPNCTGTTASITLTAAAFCLLSTHKAIYKNNSWSHPHRQQQHSKDNAKHMLTLTCSAGTIIFTCSPTCFFVAHRIISQSATDTHSHTLTLTQQPLLHLRQHHITQHPHSHFPTAQSPTPTTHSASTEALKE